MEGVQQFLEALVQHHLVSGHFRGMLRLLIGSKLGRADGSVVSTGLTWRQVAEILRVLRWDRELVRELGIDPDTLPPRDRQRFWYSAISQGHIDSIEASEQAEKLAKKLPAIGYMILPSGPASQPAS